MSDERFRRAVLRAHGASEAYVEELLAYTRNAFAGLDVAQGAEYPLSDEPFVAAWEKYAGEAERVGGAVYLRRRLVQLQFPIAAGMSENAAYRAATRRGVTDPAATPSSGVRFVCPAGLRLFIHQTAAGRVPVVVARTREDFVSLVQALTRHNEPEQIPESMGACIVAGYNNWDRIAQLRAEWTRAHSDDCSAAAWSQEFKEIVPRKELYQDRFILLSSGPYSATPAQALGLAPDVWISLSLVIRLEHECAHYFTRRAFGSMRNSLLDELIADYIGISAALGCYRADWFLRFMGLEGYPEYRPGGRLENYRGTPPLSDGAFAVLQSLVKRAAENLERFDAAQSSGDRDVAERAGLITALARLGLEALASEDGAALLGRMYRDGMEEGAGEVAVG